MFREVRRPRGDPEVLAAQSRDQYFKVFYYAFVSINVGDPCVLLIRIFYLIFLPYKLLLQLKKKLQMLTLGLGGVGLLSAYVSYSPEIAAR